MGRKIKATDARTGKPIEVDAESIKSGPIRNRSLPDPLLRRVKAIHARLKGMYNVNLEQFEVGFMRESHPEREVAVWERIVSAFERVMATMPDLDRKMVLRTLLAYSLGGLKLEEHADPVVRRIIEIGEGK
jgi:hypothetical protein